jgi:hypothetical protein
MAAPSAGDAMGNHGAPRRHGIIFSAAELNRNGLRRALDGPGLQIIFKVQNKTLESMQ